MERLDQPKPDPFLKAIEILEALKDSGKDGYGITEIAEKSGLNKSSVHRIITALTKREYVMRNEATKKYTLGYKLLELCTHLINDVPLKELARPYLESLHESVEETIHLIQRDGKYGVIIDKMNCKHSIGLLSYAGKRQLLHCTSAGKMILAYTDEEERRRLIREIGLIPMTENTIIDIGHFELELANIRANAISWNMSEDRDDVIGVAAPIFDATGKIAAALNVSGPSFRFTKEIAETVIEPLRQTAMQISRELGFRQQYSHN